MGDGMSGEHNGSVQDGSAEEIRISQSPLERNSVEPLDAGTSDSTDDTDATGTTHEIGFMSGRDARAPGENTCSTGSTDAIGIMSRQDAGAPRRDEQLPGDEHLPGNIHSSAEWKFIHASEIGTAHIKHSLPCQDYSTAQVVTLSEQNEVLILACADGAGSAPHSHIGARAVCEEIQRFASHGLMCLGDVASIEQELVRSWIDGLRSQLELVSATYGAQLSEFACTLLLGIIGRNCSLFAQVGDGAIVVRNSTHNAGDASGSAQDEYSIVFWPENGEYLNITNFITSDNLQENLQITHIPGRLDEIAMLTDGLELLALNFKEHTVHSPFFEPMFKQVHESLDPAALQIPLRQFLQSSAINAKTDDDKTLIMATRQIGEPDAPAVANANAEKQHLL